jgi:hypothetical protein
MSPTSKAQFTGWHVEPWIALAVVFAISMDELFDADWKRRPPAEGMYAATPNSPVAENRGTSYGLLYGPPPSHPRHRRLRPVRVPAYSQHEDAPQRRPAPRTCTVPPRAAQGVLLRGELEARRRRSSSTHFACGSRVGRLRHARPNDGPISSQRCERDIRHRFVTRSCAPHVRFRRG